MPLPIAALLVLALAAPGCAIVEVIPPERLHGQELATEGSTVAHVNVRNWGWYLFKFVPLATGNLSSGRVPQLPVLFRDNVQYAELLSKLTATSRELGATAVVDVVTRDKSEWRPVTLVLWLNELEVSGSAIHVESKTATESPNRPPASSQR